MLHGCYTPYRCEKVLNQKMKTQAILLIFIVGSAFGSIAIQQAKLGERVELNLGSGVDNTPVKPQSSAHVEPNGVLVIDSFQKSDEGLYSSPDLKPHETKNPDGSVSAVAAPTIQLMLAN
nr:Protein E04F6.9 [Haemonchus contortus]